MLVSGTIILYGGVRVTQAGIAWWNTKKLRQKYEIDRLETALSLWRQRESISPKVGKWRQNKEIDVGSDYAIMEMAELVSDARYPKGFLLNLIVKATSRVDAVLALQDKEIK